MILKKRLGSQADERILYLSHEPQYNNKNVDDSPSRDGLFNGITNWAKDADELVIYLVDHGGFQTFYLSIEETLKANDLKGMLDTFQANNHKTVCLIYEACMSGSFISALNSNKENRFIITSTAKDKKEYMLSEGLLSFSYQFWTYIQNGETLLKAFINTEDDISHISQAPQLDLDNDGQYNPNRDKYLETDYWIGSGIMAALPPEIKRVIGSNKQTHFKLIAEGVSGLNPIARVWGIVFRPDYVPGAFNETILTMPEVTFEPLEDNSETYIGDYTPITIPGVYKFVVYAIDDFGTLSQPMTYSLSVVFSELEGDLNGDGSIDLQDAMIAMRILARIDLPEDFISYSHNLTDYQTPIGIKKLIYILRYVMKQ